ncbi:MAG TPA: hypothetical protein DCG66_05435 [Brevundimonas sp.]|jgi:hypothetical protein|uniref:hypothetical protein n=1 Tax=uncultured Brevundimonas sp. TaxID=213418 RepID=UPI000C939511|nr:hypothetical protein [Brevundimonas sp.]HAF80439.1 hypothetical protein [Brevundimonas sp.]
MGGKRSPIRSQAPRWRPGRYRGRGRFKRRDRPRPFDPVPDTLIAAGCSLVAGLVVCVIAVPLAATYRIPLYAPFAVVMLLLTAITYRVAGRDKAGWVMAGAMALVCVLGATALYIARDEIRFTPRHHHPAKAASAR